MSYTKFKIESHASNSYFALYFWTQFWIIHNDIFYQSGRHIKFPIQMFLTYQIFNEMLWQWLPALFSINFDCAEDLNNIWKKKHFKMNLVCIVLMKIVLNRFNKSQPSNSSYLMFSYDDCCVINSGVLSVWDTFLLPI